MENYDINKYIHDYTCMYEFIYSIYLFQPTRDFLINEAWTLQDLLTYEGLQRYASVFGVVAPEGATSTEVKAAEEAIRFPSFA